MIKNFKEKIKTKSFWVAVAAAVVMLLKALGWELEEGADRIADALCGISVALGAIVSPVIKGSDIGQKQLPQEAVGEENGSAVEKERLADDEREASDCP